MGYFDAILQEDIYLSSFDSLALKTLQRPIRSRYAKWLLPGARLLNMMHLAVAN